MANPYVNKVEIKNGPVLIDLTSDTVRAQDVAAGVTFHLPTGETATGTGTDSVGLEKLIDRTISRVSHLSVTTMRPICSSAAVTSPTLTSLHANR